MKLLNTTELNYEIEQLIVNEQRHLLLLSPYLKLHKKLESILALSPANISIVFRECENINSIKKNLPKITFVQIKNLHAKAYISYKRTIVTSLNLIEFSQVNNFELGFIFDNYKFEETYKKLIHELKILFKQNNVELNLLQDHEISIGNYCIRCRREIAECYILCYDCYSKWNHNSNAPEKYCTRCGREADVTYQKPLCEECFKTINYFYYKRGL
jgi:hypothetical protein